MRYNKKMKDGTCSSSRDNVTCTCTAICMHNVRMQSKRVDMYKTGTNTV